jgi:hypothetical protein
MKRTINLLGSLLVLLLGIVMGLLLSGYGMANLIYMVSQLATNAQL